MQQNFWVEKRGKSAGDCSFFGEFGDIHNEVF